ncbi:MAG: dihydroorotate dehydrogenase (quinone) [Rickettsiales bacterium]|nr:dihydroorotate dehydrogenase (quinone) [Rickettsiales bacterium]
MDIFQITKPLLYALGPEDAHQLTIHALQHGLIPSRKMPEYAALKQTIWGLDFDHIVGMAPGFDKNAEVVGPLFKQGFAFVEAGTVTPLPQEGNPKPRVFRLHRARGIINRLGFNNQGADRFISNLHKAQMRKVVGINIGKNKLSDDAIADYVTMLEKMHALADYITVNISSPNTEGLRDLQEQQQLTELLSALQQKRSDLSASVPLLLKIAPDLGEGQQEAIAQTVLEQKIDGLIVSNTTISRPAKLKGKHKQEQGGLSGKPLRKLSTQVLSNMYRHTGGNIPIIGVGGVSRGKHAYAKIRAGASLVQAYSGFVYKGFGIIPRINEDVIRLMERDGFSHISEAIGADHK